MSDSACSESSDDSEDFGGGSEDFGGGRTAHHQQEALVGGGSWIAGGAAGPIGIPENYFVAFAEVRRKSQGQILCTKGTCMSMYIHASLHNSYLQLSRIWTLLLTPRICLALQLFIRHLVRVLLNVMRRTQLLARAIGRVHDLLIPMIC